MIDEDEKTSMHQVSSLNLMLKKKQQSPCLIVVSGKTSVGKMFKLQPGEMVIGRSVNAEIHLDDDGISRKHAKVIANPDGSVEIQDLQSTNGTYYNDERFDRLVLKDGDKIQIGSTIILKFSYQDALDESLQQNLYESATRDGLTRLYNKKHFIDALKKEFAYALRNHVELSLVMFDVDFFKRINDTYGHLAGDFVLQRLAQKVSECIRTEDTLARYGGEEFAIVLREISEEKALACAERIRRVIETTEFTFNQVRMPVSISLGIATFLNGNFTTPEQLIECADGYLYRAKRGGRNRVECRMLSG